ncbi:hypothetical protein H0H87_011278 [Tephrocybe sp. NHM501043]|nr:hypothetical protein H0H87_011278 [Tephrocybe sp. NHM501043]
MWEKKKDDPHYALYIEALEMAWGGEAEQDAERAAGKLNAKNWYDEVMQIVEDAMRTYWAAHPQAATATVPKTQPGTIIFDDFDLHCQTLLTHEDSEGWQAELCQYLKDVPADILRDTDIVEYWQVCEDLLLLSH